MIGEAVAHPMMYLDGKEVSDAEYYAETDLKTMIEAEKIKNDPKRLKACMIRKKKLAKALDSACSSITPTPSANGPTTAIRTLAV